MTFAIRDRFPNLLDANDRPGTYPPSWYAQTAPRLAPFPPLRGETRSDVCVVGGGYTGLSAALHLAEAGLDVVLIEAQRVGFGASGRNGGQVGSGQRLDQATLEAMLGRDDARHLWQIGEDAKTTVRDLIERHDIEASWTSGIVHAMRDDRGVAREHANAEKLDRDYGYTPIERLDRDAISSLTGSTAFRGGTLDRGAAHVQPLRLALGLAEAAAGAGARIHEGSRTVALDGTNVDTDAGRVLADHVILACNGYLGELAPSIAARVAPLNNFMVATEPLGGRKPLAEDVAVADDRFVVSYWRPTEDGRLLFGGGESYGSRFPRDVAAVVRRPMLDVYPQLSDAAIEYAWGGTLAITRPRMPWFARVAPGVLSASGYSGHGVAMAVMAGRILAEAVHGQTARFDVLSRVPVPPFPGGRSLRAPLLALAMGWYALRDRLGV